MKRWYLAFGLAFVLAALPAACGRTDDDDDDEAGEVEEGRETGEAGEAAEENEEADEATLRAQATISEEDASKTALAHVPGGTIEKTEIEMEDERLIWSFDIRVAGKEGIEEVHVDAKTGVIVKTEHESEADEAGEAHAN